MRSRAFLVSMAIILACLPTLGFSWSATVTNNCNPSDKKLVQQCSRLLGCEFKVGYYTSKTGWTEGFPVQIYSHVLFGQELEDSISLTHQQSRTVPMSGILCNAYANTPDDQRAWCSSVSGMACCWDVQYELVGTDGICQLRRR